MFLAGEKCAKDRVSLWLGEISSGLLRVSTWDLWALLGSLLWRRQWQPTPVLLPGKFRDGGAWWATVHGVAKKESDMAEWLQFPFSLSCIGEGNGNPLQCSCQENPRDGEAWWAAVCGVAQGRTRLKWLSSSSRFPPGKPGLSLCNFYSGSSNIFFFNFRIEFRLYIGFYVPIIEA